MPVLMCKYPPLVVVVVVVVVEVGQTGSQLIQSRLDWRSSLQSLAWQLVAASRPHTPSYHQSSQSRLAQSEEPWKHSASSHSQQM